MSEKKELNKEQLEKVNGGDTAAPKGWEDDSLNYPVTGSSEENDPTKGDIRCPNSF